MFQKVLKRVFVRALMPPAPTSTLNVLRAGMWQSEHDVEKMSHIHSYILIESQHKTNNDEQRKQYIHNILLSA
jgi:hypothetical protein